jgi:hypothetical protein
VVCSARGENRGLKPSQGNSEELQRNVRLPRFHVILQYHFSIRHTTVAHHSHEFFCSVKIMFHHINTANGQEAPLVSKDFYDFVMKNSEKLDSSIIYDRDFDYDYFGFKVGAHRNFLAHSAICRRFLTYQRKPPE